MISFKPTTDGYVFYNNEQEIAVGAYEQGVFHLLYEDQVIVANNAMQVFSMLRERHEPFRPHKQSTLDLLLKPAPAHSNLSKYKQHKALESIEYEPEMGHTVSTAS